MLIHEVEITESNVRVKLGRDLGKYHRKMVRGHLVEQYSPAPSKREHQDMHEIREYLPVEDLRKTREWSNVVAQRRLDAGREANPRIVTKAENRRLARSLRRH